MHCCRVVRAPQAVRAAAAPARNMSVFPVAFPRFPSNDFAPFFNLIDEHFSNLGSRSSIRAFQPRFDVKEVQDGYELRGELPGVEQKDIDIEFTDDKTLIVKGRSEREAHQGTPPTAEAEQAVAAPAAETSDSASTSSFQKATVEEEDPPSTAGEPTPAETPATQAAAPATQEVETSSSRYWVSERSVGEFQRTFNFPARVDQEAVKASLKNGILSIVVPKAATPAARRINVE